MECTSYEAGHNIGYPFMAFRGKRLDCTITSTEGNLIRFTTEDGVKHVRWNHNAEGLRKIQERIDNGETVTGRYACNFGCIVMNHSIITLCNTMEITPCEC